MDKPSSSAPSSRFDISFLADTPVYLETLALWSFREWGHYFPGETLDHFVRDYQSYLNKDHIPLTIVAHQNDQPIGTASLFNNDSLPGFDHLSPWLAAVYVKKDFRRQGIGQALVKGIVSEAKRLGNEKIYLWTGSKTHWYQKLGWKTVASTVFFHDPIDVMQHDLN